MITKTCTTDTIDMNSYSDSIGSATVPDELQNLRNHPLIQEFASIDNDLYELIEATNPTLRMFVDLAKKITEVVKYAGE